MKADSVNSLCNTNFKHINSTKSPYSKDEKAVVAAMTALGAGVSCAVLAKKAGYSLKPSKMFRNIKNSYFIN